MLEVLCGNKTIQKILLFLFVNGKCYGTQIHRLLKSPLTPIQKGLLRLERGGVITSFCEGKTRLYQFNPGYPLLEELENLLKKAFTLLPAEEKKNFYVAKEDRSIKKMSPKKNMEILISFWDKLTQVKQLNLSARSLSKDNGWNCKGAGEVGVTKEGSQIILFQEKGIWKGKDQEETSFSNIFRWTFDKNAGMISLERLRWGDENTAFLFHLAPSGNYSLSSVDSHLCGGDIYFGQIFFDRHCLRLTWRIIGPKKNEEINYLYI